MELNNKQLELCLHHALGQLLASWEGTAQEAWKGLLDLNFYHHSSDDFEAIAKITVSGDIPLVYLGDIVDAIETAFSANQQLAKDILSPVITIEIMGGVVTDVSGLPDGFTYEVNDLD